MLASCWLPHYDILPSGKRLHNELENHHAKKMAKSAISMTIFNSYFDITRG